MWIIVGLGNPGTKYDRTRHNVGEMFLERLLEKLDFPKGCYEFKSNKKTNSSVAKLDIYGDNLYLVKTHSFMNSSGATIKKVLDYFEINSDHLVVVSDDVNLNIGKARVRIGGESGGHKGLESIISSIGETFWRVRIGVGTPQVKKNLEDYVLEKFSSEEKEVIGKIIDNLADVVVSSISRGEFEVKTY